MGIIFLTAMGASCRPFYVQAAVCFIMHI